jgi:peptide/nickel transport system permease protein
MSGLRYILRRLALSVLVLLGVLLVTFAVSRVIPVDPARLYVGTRASDEALAKVRVELGLADPLPQQFVRYVWSFAKGDLGYSYRTKRPIIADLKVRLPATLELVLVAMVLALTIGIPTGVLAAANYGGRFDSVVRIVSIAGVSVPAFWLALLLQLVFFLWLGWLPLGGRLSQMMTFVSPITTITGFGTLDALLTGNWRAFRDAVWHIVLPALVLATFPFSLVVRMMRASMLEVLSETYIAAARAGGLSEFEIMFKLALKNAMVPTLTVMGLVFAFSITGAVLVETIFLWPGVGNYMLEAILNNDVPVLFAVTLIVTLIYIVINFLVDLLQTALDPRIRVGRREEA